MIVACVCLGNYTWQQTRGNPTSQNYWKKNASATSAYRNVMVHFGLPSISVVPVLLCWSMANVAGNIKEQSTHFVELGHSTALACAMSALAACINDKTEACEGWVHHIVRKQSRLSDID